MKWLDGASEVALGSLLAILRCLPLSTAFLLIWMGVRTLFS